MNKLIATKENLLQFKEKCDNRYLKILQSGSPELILNNDKKTARLWNLFKDISTDYTIELYGRLFQERVLHNTGTNTVTALFKDRGGYAILFDSCTNSFKSSVSVTINPDKYAFVSIIPYTYEEDRTATTDDTTVSQYDASAYYVYYRLSDASDLFGGATATTNGSNGLVPAPVAGDNNKYLKADGTWSSVTSNLTYTGLSTTGQLIGKLQVDDKEYRMEIPRALLSENDNLNNYTTRGFYSCNKNVIAQTVSNSPTTNAFALLVYDHAGTMQELTEYKTENPKKWFRNLYGDTWGEWIEVYTAKSSISVANPNPIKFQVDGTDKVSYDGLDEKTVNFAAGNNVTLSEANGTITVAAKDTTYTSLKNPYSLTILKNGIKVGDSYDGSAAKTVNITVPTKTSDLTNDSNFLTGITKSLVESVLTGTITSHDHSGEYYSATTDRTANTVLAAPNGSNGKASFRKLVAADIPDLAYIPTSSKGAASGVAELDSNGKVPSSQLPGYVDDVIDGYYNNSKFWSKRSGSGTEASPYTYSDEITGETGKIYINKNNNKIYRWSGSQYVVISETLALGETSSTAYRGDRGASAYAHAVTNKGKAYTSGLYKITTNAEGHVTDATAATKSDIPGLDSLSTVSYTGYSTSGLSLGKITIDGTDNEVRLRSKLITEGEDLNIYTQVGIYNCPVNVTVTTLANCPTTLAFSLIVLQTAGNGCYQRLVEFYRSTGSVVYYRTMYNDSWTDWERELTTKNYTGYTVKKDGTGASGSWGIDITGNAKTATTLETSRNIWGQSFNGSTAISGNMTGVGTISANGNNVITKTTTDNTQFKVVNSNGSISLLTATNRGVYDGTSDKWLIGTDGTNTFLNIGNVGIGVTPTTKLDVNGTTKLRDNTYFEGETFMLNTAKIYFTNTTAGQMGIFAHDGSYKWSATLGNLKNDGTLTIGSILPSGTTNTKNLGSSSAKYNTVYATTLEGTAKYVQNTVTDPTTSTDYYIPFINGNADGSKSIRTNNGLWLGVKNGTTSAVGWDSLRVGNAIVSGTADNKYGEIRIYSTGANYWGISGNKAITANTTLYLPGTGGCLVSATNGTAVGSATQPVYISAKGVATACNEMLTAAGSKNAPVILGIYNILRTSASAWTYTVTSLGSSTCTLSITKLPSSSSAYMTVSLTATGKTVHIEDCFINHQSIQSGNSGSVTVYDASAADHEKNNEGGLISFMTSCNSTTINIRAYGQTNSNNGSYSNKALGLYGDYPLKSFRIVIIGYLS